MRKEFPDGQAGAGQRPAADQGGILSPSFPRRVVRFRRGTNRARYNHPRDPAAQLDRAQCQPVDGSADAGCLRLQGQARHAVPRDLLPRHEPRQPELDHAGRLFHPPRHALAGLGRSPDSHGDHCATWAVPTTTATGAESGFCNFFPELNVKPSYVALATMTRVFDGAKFRKVLDLGSAEPVRGRFPAAGRPAGAGPVDGPRPSAGAIEVPDAGRRRVPTCGLAVQRDAAGGRRRHGRSDAQPLARLSAHPRRTGRRRSRAHRATTKSPPARRPWSATWPARATGNWNRPPTRCWSTTISSSRGGGAISPSNRPRSLRAARTCSASRLLTIELLYIFKLIKTLPVTLKKNFGLLLTGYF